MKKIILSAVCLLMVGAASVLAQTSVIALHHAGNVTIYDGKKPQVAFDAAVEGDTIHLSEGTFSTIIIKTPVTVIGAGETTLVGGNVETGNALSYLKLESINMQGDVFKSSSNTIDKFIMEKCRCQSAFGFNANFIKVAEIVQCTFYTFYSSTMASFNITDSKVEGLIPPSDGAGYGTFVNCNVIIPNNGGYKSWQFVNSMVKFSTFYSNQSTFVNCIVPTNSLGYQTNCYVVENLAFDDNMNCTTFDDAALLSNGYLGTDGTIVGCNGGPAPFSLEPEVPHIVEHSLNVDSSTKKLNVTLKIGQGSN